MISVSEGSYCSAWCAKKTLQNKIMYLTLEIQTLNKRFPNDSFMKDI